MSEKSNLTGFELNGVLYSLGKSIYEELDMSLERFVELLGRDLYCPTLSAEPTSSTLQYTDTDNGQHTFQLGQPCRWKEGNNYRLAVCTDITASSSSWYVLPIKVSELTNDAGYLTQHQDISGKLDITTASNTYLSKTDASNTYQAKGDYATKTELSTELAKKVDAVSGKGLSTNDFTTALKDKLDGLSNYDDTAISNSITSLQNQLNTLVNADADAAIDTFNEIVSFLDGITNTDTLEGILADISNQIAAKMDKVTLAKVATSGSYNDLSNKPTIPSAVTESAVSGWGFTKNTGTITGIKMNGSSKGTDGVVDLGTVITAHQDISGKLDATTAASTYATKTEMNKKQDKVLKFTNLAASQWVSDSTYADYPYRCDVTCSGVTADNYAEVVFALSQATSGSYAPLCETKANAVSIWSSENTPITIPTILVTI